MKAYDLIERMFPPMQAAPVAPPKPAVRPGVKPGTPGRPGPSRPWSPAPRPGVMPRPKAEDEGGPRASKFRGARPPLRSGPSNN